jgi:hypothetical protein
MIMIEAAWACGTEEEKSRVAEEERSTEGHSGGG